MSQIPADKIKQLIDEIEASQRSARVTLSVALARLWDLYQQAEGIITAEDQP